MTDPYRLAHEWLRSAYDVPVELLRDPVAETPQAWVFSTALQPTPGVHGPTAPAPPLTSLVCVPKNGMPPFHPATDDPWGDLADFERDPRPRDPAEQARRTNARGAVLAAHATVGGAPATALPWQSAHESPTWWDDFLLRYFPTAEVGPCPDWETVIAAVGELGPGTAGVVWVRRELHGAEATGHLLYAHNKDGQVALLDPQARRLARLETENVREIVLARVPPASAHETRDAQPSAARSSTGVTDFGAAVRAAEAWLEHVYGDQVVLVEPSPADETARGWLFACNTRDFLADGNPQHAMLDAALVVPKDGSVPFGLPNSDPWGWFDRWDRGAQPGVDGFPLPPEPGPAAWFAPTMSPLGAVLSVTDYTDWQTLVAGLAEMPVGSRSVVWVRRNDRRGRESVGLLCVAAQTENGLVLIDTARDAPVELESDGVRSLHLIQYR
ncbi:YrhB domain-containing protein [Actinacidiphila paucisporea]|uniref:Papain fold toxin 1, glutamine deamidase n=1 Tax=Actinacidiphila paucisporea TaxID=310782 RepID=A0A1M7KL66_9ACTN|nr:YrhB domain-containing protein [Actinacidiphila paucisporea]SHM66152.1 Papain fold toxin 1, glutamine deamidase [Actinacidiphila paucisporea]